MQIKRIIGTAAAITAATLLAGAASTASNTTPDNGAAGYDKVGVTGITVDTINYNEQTGDASKLGSMTFVSTDADAKGATGLLTVSDGAATPSYTEYTCGNTYNGTATPPTSTFECATTGQAIATVVEIGFTVTKDGTTV